MHCADRHWIQDEYRVGVDDVLEVRDSIIPCQIPLRETQRKQHGRLRHLFGPS